MKRSRGAWNGVPQSICGECGEIVGDVGRNVACDECGGRMRDATVEDLLDAGYSDDEVTEAQEQS